MGVYIPKMKMPICCGECPVICEYDLSQEARGKEKADNCPLVEVKTPHGRLIEAEMVKAKSFRYLLRNGLESGRLVFWRNIDDAPTIIESEEEE